MWIAREDRFGLTCDWPAMRFGNKPVSGQMFFLRIMSLRLN